jgi:hypothetical protein
LVAGGSTLHEIILPIKIGGKDMDYMTRQEVEDYLGVSKRRVYQLRDAKQIVVLKGGVYDANSVTEYKNKRGNKAGGPYPKNG